MIRLHADLIPIFRCTIVADEARSTAWLWVHLEGPIGLLSHDAIETAVFSADNCDETGRTVALQRIPVGEWTRYGLTPPPRPPGQRATSRTGRVTTRTPRYA